MKDIIIAFDFGASTTKMCVSELGFILNEPSFVYEDENKTLYGFEAKQKQAEFLPSLKIIDNGKILERNRFIGFVKYMLNKCDIKGFIPNILVAIPNAVDVAELTKMEKCLVECGAIKVKFLNQTQLAYGYLNHSAYKMIVDIGASKTDISIIKNKDVFSGLNLSIGTNTVNERIKEYCHNTFSIDITDDMCDKIRTNIASLNSNVNLSYAFYGLSINGNKFAKNNLQTLDINALVTPVYADICSAIETVLNSNDETIVEDIVNNGIDLIGGGSLINGLANFLSNKLNIKVNIINNADKIIALAMANMI